MRQSVTDTDCGGCWRLYSYIHGLYKACAVKATPTTKIIIEPQNVVAAIVLDICQSITVP